MRTSTVVDRSQADRFFEQGHFVQALRCYRELDPDLNDSEIVDKVKQCTTLLLRKYWRQGKMEELERFARDSGIESLIALPLARMKGEEALKTLASAETPSALLARCSAQPDLKQALLELRRAPEFKELAEGWMALAKGDAEKALLLFRQATVKAPVQAKIGEGVALLSLGKRGEANQCLAPLRLFAAARFPILHQAMGWHETQEVHGDLLQHYLFHAPLEELQAVKNSSLPQHKMLKGWVSLRIGDLLYAQRKGNGLPKPVIAAWKEAGNIRESLREDVLKRLFLSSFDERERESPCDAFFQLHRFLMKASAAKAGAFLDYVTCSLEPSPSLWLEPEDLRNDGEWELSPNTPSLQFLWLSILCRGRLNPFVYTLAIPVVAETLLDEKWEWWTSFFNDLDPFYLDRDDYLACKHLIAKINGKADYERECLGRRMLLNPLRQEEWMSRYARNLHILRAKNCLDTESTRQQFKQLLAQFPQDFDLLRFSILLEDGVPWMDQVQKHAAYLSEPFLAALKMQLAIDHGWKLTQIRPLFLAASLYGRDQEADRRFIAALLTPELKMPKKELGSIIQRIAPDDVSKHRLFSHIYNHTWKSVPISLLKTWKPSGNSSWMVHYHMALNHLENRKIPDVIRSLSLASHRLTPDDLEYLPVKYTLGLIEAKAPPSALEQMVRAMVGADADDSFMDADDAFMEQILEMFGECDE